MCDVNPDKLEAEQKMMLKKKKMCGSVCMKCKEEKGVVVVRIQDPLCRSCFLTYTTHKFRSTLGKSRLIKANDKVLLAISGGHSSTALLHLVKDALSLGAHKRLKFSPGIVCIDESAVLPPDVNQDYSHIKNLSDQFEYPFYQVPIYQGFSTNSGCESNCDLNEKDRLQFDESFKSTSTLTAKQEFITIRRMALIVQTAKKYQYSKIMIGENATTLCMKLLCNIALGRGGTVPYDIGISDQRFSDVTIIRPMREFSSKEVAVYNRYCHIPVLPPPNINTMKNASSSLQRQTEEFIIGLQVDFPSTVSTVFRTGDKISMNGDFERCSDRCALCQSPILNSDTALNEDRCKENDCCGNGECMNENYRLSIEGMKSQLCYACKLTFKDMGSRMDILPQETLDTVVTKMNRQKMKESIQDYLLE